MRSQVTFNIMLSWTSSGSWGGSGGQDPPKGANANAPEGLETKATHTAPEVSS